jgi:cell division protease FtsH
MDQLAVLLGGRVAEELVLGEVSTGAQNDLERATEIARKMVCEYGMSAELGPSTFGRRQESPFLGTVFGEERTYSEETARRIDAEVASFIGDAHRRVSEIITARRPALDRLVEVLEEREVLTGDEVQELVGAGKRPDS